MRRSARLLLHSLFLAGLPVRLACAQSSIRPQLALTLGGGREHVSCSACGVSDAMALSIAALLGMSLADRWWAGLQMTSWAEPNIVDGSDHRSRFVGLGLGYRSRHKVGLYTGVGRHAEQWSYAGVSSGGTAVLGGLDVTIGKSRGLGARLSAELVQSVTGQRRSSVSGAAHRTNFRPRLIHVGVGVIWR